MLNNLLDGDSPLDWGVPHTEWRPNQKDALDKAVTEYESEADKKRALLFELPTGSGKSSIPTALSKIDRVVTLVHSLSLLDQYKEKYGFTIVKGMAEYECINPGVAAVFLQKWGRAPRVSECPFDEMSECPVAQNCLYLVAREKALAARRMACTYPFALLSAKVQMRSGIVVFDEAHSSVEAIIQLSTMTFDDHFRKSWNLDKFPLQGAHKAMNTVTQGQIKDWLHHAIKKMLDQRPSTLFMEDVAVWSAGYKKLGYGMTMLESGDPLYFESDIKTYKGKKNGISYEKSEPYLSFKPFTARHLAWKLMKGKSLAVLMSATIGNPVPLTEELGIRNYQHHSYPHPVPVDKRPVYDLKFERMIYENIKKYPMLYKLQAKRIADFIKEMPSEWRGLILCASYDKARNIKFALQDYLGDRIFFPPENVNRVDHFMKTQKSTKGLVVVDVVQVWGQGLDLTGDLGRFVIIESVPFGNLTDPFEIERKKLFKSDYAWWSDYMTVPQACGRVTRCETDDAGEYLLNVGALADGSAMTSKAQSYYPKWFSKAIIPWKEY